MPCSRPARRALTAFCNPQQEVTVVGDGTPRSARSQQHVDLERRGLERWLVGAVIVLLAAFFGLGLANVFGQKVETKSANAAAADLEVRSRAPSEAA